MGIPQTTTAIMVFLAGLLPASCHKTSAQPKAPTSTVVASVTNSANAVVFNRNLGEIALTNHNETCVQFANGESCTLTPKILDRQNVRITLAVESKNDYGETHDFAVTQVVTKPGKPLAVAIGDLSLTFTPFIVAAE